MTAIPGASDRLSNDLSPISIPFPEATGRGVRIAVIDSGVHARHPHIFAKTSGVLVGEDEENEFNDDPAAWIDQLGHGTAVMAAIQEKAPDAEYCAIKLFSESLRASSQQLLRAIDWAIHQDMHLVNLSLGTHSFEHREQFEQLVKQASAAGVLMVCSRSEGDQPVLPGILDGVLSVDVDWTLPRQSYRIGHSESAACYFASGFPRPLRGVSPVRNLSGISFATANMTGFAARAWEHLTTSGERPSLKSMEEALRSQALHSNA